MRYKDDPRWLEARFDCECDGCHEPTRKGDRIYWYPSVKKAYGSTCGCGQAAERDFQAAAFDESFGC